MRERRRRAVVGAVVAVLTSMLVVVPAGTLAASAEGFAPAALGSCSNASSSEGVTAQVMWNGANICSYQTASSALGIDFTSNADVRFFWNDTTQMVNINDARLQMFYFGFALSTRDVIQSNSVPTGTGTFDMSWTPGILTYVLEGLYGLTASLLLTNGTTVWSENFYVKATAPYSILAALPILLILIGIYELYAVARSGRQAALGRKPPAPAEPPTEGEVATAPPAPPSGETAPPEGGGLNLPPPPPGGGTP